MELCIKRNADHPLWNEVSKRKKKNLDPYFYFRDDRKFQGNPGREKGARTNGSPAWMSDS